MGRRGDEVKRESTGREARQRRRLWQVQSRWMGRDGMGRCCDALPQVDVEVVEGTGSTGGDKANR